MLAEACGWIRFVAFHARVCASLERQAARLLDVSLSWLPVTGLTRSAVQIRIDSRPPLLLLIAGVGPIQVGLGTIVFVLHGVELTRQPFLFSSGVHTALTSVSLVSRLALALSLICADSSLQPLFCMWCLVRTKVTSTGLYQAGQACLMHASAGAGNSAAGGTGWRWRGCFHGPEKWILRAEPSAKAGNQQSAAQAAAEQRVLKLWLKFTEC